MSPEGATRCAHCGLPSPPAPAGELSFCCRGCQSAYQLLHEMGLGDYYGLRQRLAPDLQAPLDAPRADDFEHLDDEERQARLGNRPGEALLGVDGLHCAACVWVVEEMGQRIEGVDEIRVDLASGRLRVGWDPERVQLSQVAERLATLGYEVHALDADRERKVRRAARRERWRLAIAGAAAGNVMLFSIALYLADFGAPMEASTRRLFEWSAFVATLPAVTYGAFPFYRGALGGLRARRLHMDLPISIGLLVGFGASLVALLTGLGELYFDSAATLVFLLLLGRHVQGVGNRQALSEAGIMELLLPAMAERIGADGQRERISAHRLEPGDRVEVLDGQRIPVDGIVQGGVGHVDASTLTGESVPLRVEPGSTVHAGTAYTGETLMIETSAVGAATRVGALARRIVDASNARPRLQRMVDRLTGTFSGAVLLVAVLASFVWWYIDPARVLPVTISLLVISCPCALGLATPVVMAIARARAARQGLLLHDSAVIEALGEVEQVVFDKTGTLTQGQPSVRFGELDERAVAYVRALEAGEGHPLARALYRWTGERGSSAQTAVQDRRVHAGRGVSGRIDGREVRVGSPAWLGLDESHTTWGERLGYCLSRAWTPVGVEVDGELVGLVGVGDALRPEARRVIASLRRAGLRPVIASGDHPRVVEALAADLGIEEHHGAMSPEGKAELVAARPSWMIGDGINDAPALRAARVGLAMGGGAEIALEVADASSVQEGLVPAWALYEGAARARRAVRFNLGFALTYNLLFATLAALGLVNPLVAAIIMPLSSISVVLAAMWTRTFDAGEREPRRDGEHGAEPVMQRMRVPPMGAASAAGPKPAV